MAGLVPVMPERPIISIDYAPFRIGRAPKDSDHTPACTEIPFILSRKHAKFVHRNPGPSGYWAIKDMFSINGTYVNMALLVAGVETEITSGDIISFGGPSVVYRQGQRLENPLVYTFYTTEGLRLRAVRLRGLLRCIAPLMAWRRSVAEVVFAPEHGEVLPTEDGELQMVPSPRLLLLNHEARVRARAAVARLQAFVRFVQRVLRWRRRAAIAAWRCRAEAAAIPSKRRRLV